MGWVAYVAGAVLSWGVYGAMLHQGQVKLGSPMRALLVRRGRLLPDRRGRADRDAHVAGSARCPRLQ